MAHVVGVPKREPCQKCSLPVFLAERLTVGKKVYHRTCLKCARCETQLTPGSFYETETDGEYCCETCPDEEKLLTKIEHLTAPSSSSPSAAIADNVSIENRFSSKIADRLAFFERRASNGNDDDGKRLLQKSLSDEEKSKSLKKMEENQRNMFQATSAFNNFLSNHYSSDVTDSKSLIQNQHENKDEEELINNKSRKNSTVSSTSSSGYDDIEEQTLPELPKSEPPLSSTVTVENDYISGENTNQSKDTPHEDLSVLENNNKLSLNQENEKLNRKESVTTIEKVAADNNFDQFDFNDEQISDHNSSFNVTKDSFEDAVKDNSPSFKTDVDKCNKISNSITGNLLSENEEADNSTTTTNQLSMVRSRLHQFEIIANKTESSKEKASNYSINSSNNLSNNTQINNSNPVINKDSDDNNETLQDNEVPIMKLIHSSYDENNENLKEKDTESNEDNNIDIKTQTELNEKDELFSNNTQTPVISNVDTENEYDNQNNETKKKNLSENKQHLNAINNSNELEIEIHNTNDNHDVVDSYEKSKTLNNNNNYVSADKNISAILKTTESLVPTKSPEKLVQNLVRNSSTMTRSTLNLDEYPDDLNPFKSDEEDDENNKRENDDSIQVLKSMEKRKSLNPFESDEEDEEKNNKQKIKPPRPPPPKKRISTNPFGSESEDEEEDLSQSNSVSSGTRRTPVPTPRNFLSKSQNPTPEPTPRITRQAYGSPLKNSGDYHSSTSLSPINFGVKVNSNDQFNREESFRASTNSLTNTSIGSGAKRKNKKAPAPPPPPVLSGSSTIATKTLKELFPTPIDSDSKKSSPSSSNTASPKLRKKRPAPAPPSLDSKIIEKLPSLQLKDSMSTLEQSHNYDLKTEYKSLSPIIPQIEKLSDEEKALLENNLTSINSTDVSIDQTTTSSSISSSNMEGANEIIPKKRLIALDISLKEDSDSIENSKVKVEDNVVYRRKIVPISTEIPRKDFNIPDTPVEEELEESHDRQLEKLKDNKEAQNRNRQSHISLNADDCSDPVLNKSVQGKWKRRKGPAPLLPVPPRKVIQMLPLQEIRHELEVIEVQQQGLEKQGVMLEKMIRDRCEGQKTDDDNNKPAVNSKEVEDLIMQLFELVNEKNELFRRQAELMYLRRQHRLEQEQADLEYEIRVLMAQPERNKTDSDKAREESLIARLVEVVQLRNEVIECLEMDRLREAEEDMSIKQRLEMHTAKRDEELCKQTPTKLSKKEKKKQKELKKVGKSKKLDADKDADESETAEKLKAKKKKKKFLF